MSNSAGGQNIDSSRPISNGMKTAGEVYEEYNIMPNLQLHQLRVAAVARLICRNLTKPVNEGDVVLACLFHDMGNIIKSDLKQFPEFRADEGVEYWEGIKNHFIEKKGENAHLANVAIAKEIGLPPAVIAYIDGISFSNLAKIVLSDSFEQKICEYADTRVGPHSVLSLQERLAEARARYIGSGKSYYTEDGFLKLSAAAEELEKQVCAKMRIKPEDITDAAVVPVVEELRNYSIA